jgi:peptide/nickel transport system substrate-binding protein
MTDSPSQVVPSASGGIRAFLIADVRGYTLFTQQRGDDAAAKLAKRFSDIAREVLEARGGSVIELRGDEALCVFSSARQAIIAAADLQERFVDETAADVEYPLPVGIGLDAGEAVPLEGGYRGAALNLAARLCGHAGPGEILASRGAVHLAGKVEGIRYVDRGSMRFKNVLEPVAFVRVLPEKGDPAERLRAHWQPLPSQRRRGAQRRLIAAITTIALIAATLFVVLRRGGPGGPVAAGSVGFLEASSGRLSGQIPVGDAPEAIAIGAGAVWVTDRVGGTVARIDARSGVVLQRIQVGSGPGGVAVAAGHVWVTNSDTRTVSRINPGSAPGQERVVATVPVGNGPLGIAADGTELWVANSIDATLAQIDARTGEVVGTFPVGALPTGVAVGGGAVWVTERGANALAQIDPTSGKVLRDIPVGHKPTGIAWGENAIWVVNADDGTVSRVDPETASVTATVRVGTDPVSVAVAAGRIWVANAGDGTISRLDPTATLLEPISIRNSPRGLAAVGDSVWAAVQASAASHRGGTLTVAAGPAPGSLDPGDIFDLFELDLRGPMVAVTNDGLVAFRRVGGIGGSSLVADLAAELPVPTDRGRTYTFVLRSGIQFSTGEEVGPEDVRATFERLLSKQGASGDLFLRHVLVIEGAAQCTPEVCDLSDGIDVDDASRTVTFHLTEPDPDFLRHLALPNFVILPAGTPVDLGRTPPPATGPYEISSFTSESLVFERNPVFREWSSDAQPAGFPDRIVVRFGMDSDDQVDAVEQGTIDLMYFDSPSPERMEELQTRFPEQVHQATSRTTLGFFLNVDVPPFDDVRARQAVAFALDRGELARLASAERPGPIPSVTCNVISPNVLGYVPYCPHTLNPNELGVWSAPDLARARGLVRASGTNGMDVTVWSLEDRSLTAQAVARVLDSLGYRASLKLLPGDSYEGRVRDPSTEAQIGITGFDANSAAPSEFIRDGFACPRPEFQPPWNFTGFCDREIDRRIDEALSLQQSDPYAAARAWAALDRDLVDRVPIIVFATPVLPRVVSTRVGNYQSHPVLGVLLDQLWVQ